ncbi:MAG: glutamyl-tRNA reductase [Spirochaetia bacterium]|jgi:glutamyl-tRNA reductase|nr:glutamyl-tRNA reductase [Spirochaetia bacterium]
MKFLITGLNHRTMPIELREKFAFPRDEAQRFLVHLKESALFTECLIVSTCNRLEILARYGLPVANDIDAHDKLVHEICSWKHIETQRVQGSFYHYSGAAAVQHLFRVASGLDSQLLGETQILHQLKNAYRMAGELGSNGFFLNRLMHAAFCTGKRTRSETRLGIGAVSVGLAAADWLFTKLAGCTDPAVLVIGAGEMARLAATHLKAKGIHNLSVSNRTESRARELADRLPARFLGWDEWSASLHYFDGLVVATAAPQYLISKNQLDILLQRKQSVTHIVDLGVPRNVESDAFCLDGYDLADVDDLKALADGNLQKRVAEVPLVEAIIRDEQEKFLHWYRSLEVIPTIKRLLELGERYRQELLDGQRNKWNAGQLEAADLVTRSLVKKILKAPLGQLRESVSHGPDNSAYWVAMVEQVFKLDGE